MLQPRCLARRLQQTANRVGTPSCRRAVLVTAPATTAVLLRRCPRPPHPIRSLPPPRSTAVAQVLAAQLCTPARPRTRPLPFPVRLLHFTGLWQLQSPLVAAPAAAASRKARGGKEKARQESFRSPLLTAIMLRWSTHQRCTPLLRTTGAAKARRRPSTRLLPGAAALLRPSVTVLLHSTAVTMTAATMTK